ncbi:hypothetical protein BT67DRAFT_465256 [Trichocladium antarcticum]|uniref:Uncharacterized protein n=1 Tax=Trichocladium antarcticum TaxID=1450529 RepID=A0AAN6UBP8_9PEZI|nr:hypothetical protein BT67DRAFT_465256 [Trichocladium antarcticum]
MQRINGRTTAGRTSRLKPVEIDPLAEYGLPSKGETRLLSPKVQEAYYAKIVERYLALCTEAGDHDSLQARFARLAITPPAAASSEPSRATTNPATTLPQLLAALRKLREALVATARHDDFAAQVYLFAIRLGILAGHPETYHPALLHVLHTSAHNGPQKPTFPLTRTEHAEALTYLILDTAHRRANPAEALSLLHTHRATLLAPTLPPSPPTTTTTTTATPLPHNKRGEKLPLILKALVADNWVAWRRLKAQSDGLRARLMEFAEPEMRRHTLRAFGRAYLSVPVGVLEAQTGRGWDALRREDGVGWELEEGGRVDSCQNASTSAKGTSRNPETRMVLLTAPRKTSTTAPPEIVARRPMSASAANPSAQY